MALKNAQVGIGAGIQVEAKSEARAEVRLSLVVSPELNDTLEELAQRSHSTKSDILRKALALFDVASQAKQKDQKIGILDQDDQVVKEIIGI
jgi:predicted transcriptional regulator